MTRLMKMKTTSERYESALVLVLVAARSVHDDKNLLLFDHSFHPLPCSQ